MTKKKVFIMIALTMIICIMTLGYAALQEQLDITGGASINSTYRVEITKIEQASITGSATVKEVPSYTELTANFNVGLTTSTDTITYNIEISNLGTVDVRLNNAQITTEGSNQIEVSKSGVANGDILLAGEAKVMTIEISYTGATEVTGNITINLDYTRLKGGTGQVVEEKPIYTFGALSDIHLDTEGSDGYNDFNNTIKRLEAHDIDFVAYAGDIGSRASSTSFLESYKKSIEEYATVPYYTILGNHDVGYSAEDYRTYTGNEFNYAFTHYNDAFIFMSLDNGAGTSDVPYSEATIEWLESKLNEYSDKRVFLIMHYALTGYAGLIPGEVKGFSSSSTVDDQILKLMESHGNVITFSGDSHYLFEVEDTYPGTNVTNLNNSNALVHIPSANIPRKADRSLVYDRGEAWIVEVYTDKVELKALDISPNVENTEEGDWLTKYDVTLNIGQTINDDPITTNTGELKYIEATGGQAINTEFCPNQDTRVVMEIEITSLESSSYSFGSDEGSKVNSFGILNHRADGWSYRYGSDFADRGISIEANKKVTIELNKNVITIDGETRTLTAQTFQSTTPIYLLAGNRKGLDTLRSPAYAKLYSAKVYDNGVLVRDFVPYMQNGEVGVYDKVNDKFYTNIGTGEFQYGELEEIVLGETSGTVYIGGSTTTQIIGEDYGNLSCKTSNGEVANCEIEGTNLKVTGVGEGSATITVSEDKNNLKGRYKITVTDTGQLAAIIATGTQYIDTGYKPNNKTKVVVEFMSTQTDETTHFIFGGSTSKEVAAFELAYTDMANRFESRYNDEKILLSALKSDVVSQKIIAEKDGKNLTILDTTSSATNEAEFSSAYNLFIFSYNRGGDTTADKNKFVGELYSFKIYDNGVLVRDLVPYMKNGEVGVYDKVNNQFYTNKGTGTFGYK